MQRLQEQAQGRKRKAPLVTPHQFAVLEQVTLERGMPRTLREIGKALKLSEHGVKEHWNTLRRERVLSSGSRNSRVTVAIVEAVVVAPARCCLCGKDTFLTRCCGQPTHNAQRGPR